MLVLEPELKLSLWVEGRPRTKGSMKCLGARVNGKKHTMVEDHATSKPWRIRMTNEIVREVRRAGVKNWVPYSGGLAVRADFRYERLGPSAQLSPWPIINGGIYANGDLDKLLRNLLDALQGSGLIKDDCLVVRLSSTKQWSAPGMPPGVQFSVEGLGKIDPMVITDRDLNTEELENDSDWDIDD